jgi:hypothetical protein
MFEVFQVAFSLEVKCPREAEVETVLFSKIYSGATIQSY